MARRALQMLGAQLHAKTDCEAVQELFFYFFSSTSPRLE